MGAIFSSESCH